MSAPADQCGETQGAKPGVLTGGSWSESSGARSGAGVGDKLSGSFSSSGRNASVGGQATCGLLPALKQLLCPGPRSHVHCIHTWADRVRTPDLPHTLAAADWTGSQREASIPRTASSILLFLPAPSLCSLSAGQERVFFQKEVDSKQLVFLSGQATNARIPGSADLLHPEKRPNPVCTPGAPRLCLPTPRAPSADGQMWEAPRSN
ncbi:PREDICTED: uncharacterized protein LOC102016159 [Chinchilla lanigera]|uniref:uncharacterized protein LOC102016159 n=1 Tax=Chinchilla lanigera TaxID=34839 RepID=UPI000695FEE9|nr:PREDICTED: uncharacterized protein LOC102016159 [Chinchilla lanigera]